MMVAHTFQFAFTEQCVAMLNGYYVQMSLNKLDAVCTENLLKALLSYKNGNEFWN
jgi:hypothetical protein